MRGLLDDGAGKVTLPKRAKVGRTPHRLAYIRDDEAALLRAHGGGVTPDGGQLMHRGVPAYEVADEGGTADGRGHDPGYDASAVGGYDNGGDGGYGYGGFGGPADDAQRALKARLDAGEYVPSETPWQTPAPVYGPPVALPPGGPTQGMARPFQGFGAQAPVMQPYAMRPAPALPQAAQTLPPAPSYQQPAPLPAGFFDALRFLRGF